MNVKSQVMSQVPAKLRMPFLMGTAGLYGLLVFWMFARVGRHAGLVLVGGTLVLVLIAGLIKLIRDKRRRRRAERAEGAIVDAARGSGGESDPKKIADIDKDDKAWLDGLEKYRKYKKSGSLVDEPIILVVGESGSGKSEAIRHSAISFPKGLEQRYQGTGGTLYMSWWFASDAIILDTAGRLMLPEDEQNRSKDKPGGRRNAEWAKFLQKVNRARPACPINGMLLFIPATSLLEDSLETIGDKAGRISTGLACITEELGIRFPVYIVVSMCDKIKGFREFFAQLNDPILQHQMLGWSNPAGLDDPFEPKQIDQHLATVRERLRRRRMTLLLDPPHIPGASMGGAFGGGGAYDALETSTYTAVNRRIDHVDSLFIFPEEMMRIAPRLRLYAEKIFMPDYTNTHPPFVRGIYFTSSMQEGAELDAALAELMGVSIKEVPEVGGWRKDKAYFIKDVLTEKVFPEKGLVSRATNAAAHYRRNKWLVNAVGVAAVGLALMAGFFAWWGIRGAVLNHADNWRNVAQVVSTEGVPQASTNAARAEEVLGRSAKSARASDNIALAGVYAPIRWLADPLRGEGLGAGDMATRVRSGHRDLVRASLSPLVGDSATKLASTNDVWPEQGVSALAQLILASGGRRFDISPLLELGHREKPANVLDLQSALDVAYPEGREGPAFAVPNVSAAIRQWGNAWKGASSPFAEIAMLANALNEFDSQEKALLGLWKEGSPCVERDRWSSQYGALDDARAKLAAAIAPFGGIDDVVAEGERRFDRAQRRVQSEHDALAAAIESGGDKAKSLEEHLSAAWNQILAATPSKELIEGIQARRRLLERVQGEYVFASRFNAYAQANSEFDRSVPDDLNLLTLAGHVRALDLEIAIPDQLDGNGKRLYHCVIQTAREQHSQRLCKEALDRGPTALLATRNAVANAARVNQRDRSTLVKVPLTRLYDDPPTVDADFDRLSAANFFAGVDIVRDCAGDPALGHDYRRAFCDRWSSVLTENFVLPDYNHAGTGATSTPSAWGSFQQAVEGTDSARAWAAISELHGQLSKIQCENLATPPLGVESMFHRIWTDRRNAWLNLASDPAAARRQILNTARLRGDFTTRYISGYRGPDDTLAQQYIDLLIEAGFAALAADATVGARHLINDLQEQAFFPLTRVNRAPASVETASRIAELRSRLGEIGDVGIDEMPPYLPEVLEMLRALGGSIEVKERQYLQRVRAVLDALPGEGRTLNCAVTLKGSTGLGRYQRIALAGGERKPLAANQTLGAVRYPNDQGVEFSLYDSIDGPVTRTVRFSSQARTWDPILLIHLARNAETVDGKTWIVELSLTEDTRAQSAEILTLQLEFDQPLPMLGDWP